MPAATSAASNPNPAPAAAPPTAVSSRRSVQKWSRSAPSTRPSTRSTSASRWTIWNACRRSMSRSPSDFCVDRTFGSRRDRGAFQQTFREEQLDPLERDAVARVAAVIRFHDVAILIDQEVRGHQVGGVETCQADEAQALQQRRDAGDDAFPFAPERTFDA